jgi:hypothetical protein
MSKDRYITNVTINGYQLKKVEEFKYRFKRADIQQQASSRYQYKMIKASQNNRTDLNVEIQ